MGERMEIQTSKTFSWSYLSLQEAGAQGSVHGRGGWSSLPHGSEFLITRVNTASGTHHWGWGGERVIRKNIHLEFFLFCLSTLCH